MLEGLLALAIFGSFTWFCIISAIVLCAFFWSENVRQGGIAFAALVVFLIINYYWGNVPVSNYISWVNVLVYLGLGFIYAIIRSYNYGAKTTNKERDMRYLKGNVFRWWFLFPISLINWILSDLFADFYNFLYRIFKNTFEYFFNLGAKKPK